MALHEGPSSHLAGHVKSKVYKTWQTLSPSNLCVSTIRAQNIQCLSMITAWAHSLLNKGLDEVQPRQA